MALNIRVHRSLYANDNLPTLHVVRFVILGYFFSNEIYTHKSIFTLENMFVTSIFGPQFVKRFIYLKCHYYYFMSQFFLLPCNILSFYFNKFCVCRKAEKNKNKCKEGSKKQKKQKEKTE